MEYAFNKMEYFKNYLLSKDIVYLFFDYDGTLTPICEKPQDAVLDEKARKVLEELADNRYYNVVIISGRELSDVKDLVKIKKRISYAGNHGLEIEYPGGRERFVHPLCDASFGVLSEIYSLLKMKYEAINISAVIVENKRFSLSVHYRLVKSEDVGLIKKIFNEVTEGFVDKGLIKVTEGKKVLEIRPPIDWNKGAAVRKILSEEENLRTGVIFIGDDKTDEDVFRILKDDEIGIYVGENKDSAARFYVKDTGEVTRLLKFLLETKKND